MSQLLCLALAHPEYQRLRRVWHSLRALAVSQADNCVIELQVVSSQLEMDALEAALGQVQADLVVIEAPFEACPRDVELLNFVADWAASWTTPVIATLGVSWVVPPSPSSPSPKPKLAPSTVQLLGQIAVRPQARWLTLALNDVCDADPIAGPIVRNGPSCYQPKEADSSWTFLPAGVAVANVVMTSMVRDGEPYFPEASGSAQLRSRALYELRTRMGQAAVGTRWFCSDEVALDFEQLGLCVLAPTQNRDRVRLVACPTAHRPRNAGGDLGVPTSTLRDQVLAGKVTRLLLDAKASIQDGVSVADAVEQLKSAISSLFPKAPPVGPSIDVVESRGHLVVGVRPRRYGQLTVEELNLSVPLR
jgi:hypothetical protein